MTKNYLARETDDEERDAPAPSWEDGKDEPEYSICPDCGEDLEHHDCTTPRIPQLNDEFRTTIGLVGLALQMNALVITSGVAAKGNDFINRAMKAVRSYSAFTEDNDPHHEHDFGDFTLDGVELYWKIDYYDRKLEYHSPNAAEPDVTRRVLTVLLADEY